MITEQQWNAVRKHMVNARVKLILTDDHGVPVDDDYLVNGEIYGVCNGGSLNIDGQSAVRRTGSFSFSPDDKTVVQEGAIIWITRNIRIQLIVNGVTFEMGRFLYSSVSSTYDASTNIMTIELSDYVTQLDGTINGQIGGELTTTIPAYKEDPETGEPLEYSTIKGALERTLASTGMTEYDGGSTTLRTYVVEDVGEYYAMPQYSDDWEDYRARHPLWNTVPYDLEFSVGCTVWDIIDELVNLYPNYEAAFDEYGTFRVQMIPSELTEGYREAPYDFEYEDYMDMVISENTQTDLTTVRNICEVWGATLDADWYAEGVQHRYIVDYQIWFDKDENGNKKLRVEYYLMAHVYGGGKDIRDTYEHSVTQYTTRDEDYYDLHIHIENSTVTITSKWTYLRSWWGDQYNNGDTIVTRDLDHWNDPFPNNYVMIGLSKYNLSTQNYIVTLEGYPKDYRTSTRFGVKFSENSYSGQYMQINDLEPLVIIDQSTNQPIGADFFDLDEIHVFQVMKICPNPTTAPDDYVHQLYYVGVAQSHAISVLSNGQEGPPVPYIDDQGVQRYVNKYSKQYYEIFLNCRDVELVINPDSPFVVQKLGDRISVKADGEFSNIRSNELAIERARYENWKNARIADNITVVTKLMPFVVPNMKITYHKHDSEFMDDYMVMSVAHDLDNGTTTMNLSTFYPLYIRTKGNTYLMTYKYMSGFPNEYFYGDQDDHDYS